MSLPFEKMSGAGNMFIVADEADLRDGLDRESVARSLCLDDPVAGSVDGFILVGKSDRADFGMHYYNPDGSSGMMCGNGGRCAVDFAVRHGYAGTAHTIRFTAADRLYSADFVTHGIRLYLPPPTLIDLNRTIAIDDESLACHFVEVGTEHVVLFLEDLGSYRKRVLRLVDLPDLGPEVRYHSDYPRGTNANFVSVLRNGDGIELRTWERGVERETGACGTGAVASAIVAGLLHDLPRPVRIVPTSKSPLFVDFDGTGPDEVDHVSLEGGVTTHFSGRADV